MVKKIKEEEVEPQVAELVVDEEDVPVVVRDENWIPKTELGRKVASGEITDIHTILDRGLVIMEKGIVEMLLPNLESDLLFIGRAKGKFGGGKKRTFRQTQKKTKEGNKPKFATLAVVGNKQGVIGIGYGKSKETVPAREKAVRNAKFNIFKIRRGCGSWECGCGEPHSLPFIIEGRSGSSMIRLIPAPKGTGLRVDKEVAKLLSYAGISDVWSKTFGQSRKKLNLLKATEDALKKTMSTKLQDIHYQRLSVVEGATGIEKAEAQIKAAQPKVEEENKHGKGRKKPIKRK